MSMGHGFVRTAWSASFAALSSLLLMLGSAAAQAPAPVEPPPAPGQVLPPATPTSDDAGVAEDSGLPPIEPAPAWPPAPPPEAVPTPLAPEPPSAAPDSVSPPAAPSGESAPSPGAAAESAAAAEPTKELDQIIVTARHRSENLQEVPIAVTALTGADLKATGAFNLRQIQNSVPSLSILGFNPRNITIQIRGLGTTAGTVNSGIEPGVGVYVNGVYFARPSIAVFDLFDVEGVEVLRGPQGTLFGKNTVGGVIDIHTNHASYTPEFSAEMSYGNYNYSQLKVAASAPLGKSGFAVRLAGIKTDRDGTIYNTVAKQPWQDLHNRGVRGELAYRTDDQHFRARLIGDYNEQKEYSGFQVARAALPKTRADGSVATTRGFYDRASDLGYTPLPIDPSARKVDLNTPYTVNMQTGGVSLQLDEDLWAGHTATSVSAWRFWDWNPSLDGDRTALSINTQSNLPTNQRQYSQELRIASASGKPIEYTTGLYYFHQSTKEVPYNTYGSDAAAWLLGPAFPSAALNNVTQSGHQLGIVNSYSAFVNSTWHALKQLDFNGGLRYTYETRTGSFSSYPITTNSTPLTDPVFAGLTTAQITQIQSRRDTFAPTSAFHAKADNGQVSGTLNALYKITEDLNAYAGYSRGFKSAGINMAQPVQLANGPAPTTFKPETVNAYEIGFKSKIIDRRLTTNVALFRSDDKGYQANQNLLVDTSSGPILKQYLTNVGKVRTQGVEVDLRARPVTGLTITSGLTFNDAKYVDYKNGQCSYMGTTAANHGVCDLSGRQLPGVSKWVYNVAAQYEFDVSSLVGFETLAYLRGNWNQRTGYYGTLNTDPYGRILGYGLLGAFFGFRAPQGGWDLKFWARNLLNKTYFINSSVDTATTYTAAGSLGDPRFYGTTLQIDL